MEDYKTAAQKKAQETYMNKAVRVQLVLNPDNEDDAKIIKLLEGTFDGKRPAATRMKHVLLNYIAIKKALNI